MSTGTCGDLGTWLCDEIAGFSSIPLATSWQQREQVKGKRVREELKMDVEEMESRNGQTDKGEARMLIMKLERDSN